MSPMSPRLLRPVASGVHPEAAAWRQRVIDNGGTVSGSTLSAVSKFCRRIDATAGLRAKFRRLSLMCGDNLLAALVPLYRNSSSTGTQVGGLTDTNVAVSGQSPFVSGDYTLTGGLVGTGYAYLDTDLDTTDFSGTTGHIAVYHKGLTLTDTTTRYFMGSASGSHQFQMAARLSSSLAQLRFVYGGIALNNVNAASSVLPGGLRVVTRSSNSDLRAYLASTEISSVTTELSPGVVTHINDFFIFGTNSAGTPLAVGSYTLYGYSIGAALTVDDVAAYNTAISEFQSAIGRTT